MRRTLLALALAAGALAVSAPAASACQPESCPPPCPFTSKPLNLLCPAPV